MSKSNPTGTGLEASLADAVGHRRVAVLNDMASRVAESEPERAVAMSREALELAVSLGDRSGEAAAQFGLGDCARVSGDHRGALEHYAIALDLFTRQGDTLQKGRCLRRLGDIHYFVTNLDLSLRYYLRALRVFENAPERDQHNGARLQAGHLLSTIGNVLKDSGDFNGALDYYRRSHSVYEREGFTGGLPGVLYNIALIQQEKGMLEDARRAYQKVLQDANERDDHYLASLALNSLGSVCLADGDFPGAEACFISSLETSEKTGRKRGVLSSLLKRIELQRVQGHHEAALELSEQAERLSVELNDRGAWGTILRERAHLLEKAGDHAGALTAICSFQNVQEELLSEKRLRQIDILRLRYETEAKEREIERLRREKAVQKTMIAAAALGLVFAGISLSAVYRSFRLRTRMNSELSRKNLELASAYSRVEELSRTDDLTGLANRRAMLETLQSEQARSVRTGRAFGLILGDIDDFKGWNDRCGHECGDAILVMLSMRFQRGLREQDLASRWGGEEFLILLPDTNLAGSERVAEKLRLVINREPFVWKSLSIDLTMTFGVCEGGGVPIDAALRMADNALYEGKRLGKNRVEAYSGG